MALHCQRDSIVQLKFLWVFLVIINLFSLTGKCRGVENFKYERDPAEVFELISSHHFSPQKILPVNTTNKLCVEDSRILLEDAKSFQLEALHVLDSWGKIPSGILYGNINQFGNFDQCVKANGKYCLASLSFTFHPKLDSLIYSYHAIRSNISDSGHRVPRFSVVQWGLCLPKSCSSTDVENAVYEFLTNASFITNVKVKIEPRMCQAADNKPQVLRFGTFLALLFFCSIFFVCIFSTAIEPIMAKNRLSNEILSSFSFRKNWKTLTNINSSSNDIHCIDGIRFMSAISLLLSHKQMAQMFLPYINRTPMAEITGMAWSTIGRTAILHTDTFIFLSGFLTARGFFKDYERNRQVLVKHSIISRLFRLTPNLAAVIIFCTWILPVLNWGPLWPQVITTHSDICKTSFWKNLLYIHNFYPFDEMCLTHTHQLGIDMQLYLSSFFLVYLLWNWQKAGFAMLILVASLSTYLRYTTTVAHNLSTIVHFGIPISRLMKTADYSYIRPSHRMTVYIMGILVSHYLHFRKTKVSWSKILTGWMFFLSLGFLTVIGPFSTGLLNYNYNVTDAAFYATFAPILWCSFVSWGLISSYYNYAGWFGKFLSWKGFKIFTRISYAVYLTQFPIFFYNVGTTKISKYYSPFDLFNIGEFFCIFIASILLTLMFDLPFQNLQKVLLPKKYGAPSDNENNETSNHGISNNIEGSVDQEIVPEVNEAQQTRRRHIRFHGS